ncbi:UDP-N-acetyl-D-glucosamine dehydrogenase [Ruegeria halocynthiae]|uniref:UDP-N-acetyl-D-glucosamine dehydrogenase n=1 Tax=Ruegeria halocynthiae TaxID=985054 RepID=A0A1H2Y5Y5_9RHOB|nr:nucleotide sugar dehydrogenase [Ruegeria halocynthiae]SDX00490.1 UDP-N-acetyl-D-glucosamine dehydrogenase [Ruegeria halocynthiae]
MTNHSKTHSALDELLQKLSEKRAVIGIVGLGYVGQPLALRYTEIGYRVIGFDLDAEKVQELNSGYSSIEHIDDARIAEAGRNGFEATTDFSRIAETDGIMLCVPTPLNKYREPDLSFVTDTCDQIADHLRSGQVVALESTTYPGTTKEEVLPRLERNGLKVGEDIFAVYSPEREDPANPEFTTNTIPKVVGGHTDACLKAGIALYEHAIDSLVPVSSTETAEMTKLLENIHRAVNIGLVNEMKIVADRMGIDIFEVIDAAATKPFGFTPYYPGPGLGGHCIPIDPFYLTWKAREYGINTRFIELAGEVNTAMPEYVFGKLATSLNERCKAVRGSKIMVLGIAYKKNVDDMRESPSVTLMELIRDNGGELCYSDPHVPEFPTMREHFFELSSVALTPEVLAEQDAVVLATNHDAFDYDLIKKHAKLLIDTRGKYRTSENHIVRA